MYMEDKEKYIPSVSFLLNASIAATALTYI
jgi:hypothetical protein